MSNEAPAGPTEPTPTSAATPPPAPAKKRPVSKIVTPILALVAALAIGLFGGILIGHNSASADTQTRAGFGQRAGGFGQEGGTGAQGGTGQGGTGQGGTGGQGGGFAGGGFTSGTVVSVDGSTVTIKTTAGKTVKVTTTDNTTVTKTSKSSVSSLKAGETVTAIGQADSSGDVTARTITEGSTGFGFRAGGGTGGPAGN
jgi:hypothetical protein